MKYWTVLITLFIVFLYSFRIYFPAEPYYDEVYYVNLVRELINHQHFSTSLTTHPPLAAVFDTITFLTLGDYSVVWRLSSLVAGLVVVYLVFRLAESILKDRLAAGFAVVFYVFDCISLTQARIEMPNTLSQMFMLLSLFFLLKFIIHRDLTRSRAFMSAGIFLGLAMATKLTSVSWLIFYLGILTAVFFRSRKDNVGLWKDVLLWFFTVPVLIFFASHLFIPFLKGHHWSDIWTIQITQMNYLFVIAPTQTHGYSSLWWGWPLLLRPIWYFFQQTDGMVQGIICIGNPVIFWSIPFVVVYLLWDIFLKRSWVSLLILWGFLSQWIFFAFGKRIKFFHYFDNAMPFIVLAIAMISVRLWRAHILGRCAVVLYMSLVAGMFMYWYPLLTGFPISQGYFQQHMWFRSWI
ncbi:MAG: glycosyltransferase family 39 protein [Candidatus Omnitrophica bacterium]|nr:glycosyltransferase family 39 protein [Candidatus Omnitrophota bacterium]